MKNLHVLATMHELGRFTVAEVAEKARVPTSSVHTIINRSPDTWFSRRQLPSGTRGGQPTQFELSAEGRVAIVEKLGEVSSAVRLAPARLPSDVPLGLQSALDTLEELGKASNSETVALLYADAMRDLQWAEAEVKGTGYARDAKVLLEQLSQARAELAAFAPTVEVVEQAPAQAEAEPVSVVEAIQSVPSTATSVARAVYETVYDLVAGMWGDSGALAPHTLTTLRSGRHVIIGRLGGDKGSEELSLAAMYALQGALVHAKAQAHDLGLRVHRFDSEQLAKLLLQARDLSHLQANSLFLLIVNSDAGEAEARRSVERTQALKLGFNAAILDRAYSESLQEFSQRNRVRYEPKAAEPSHLGWVNDTVSRYATQSSAQVGHQVAAG